jgi:hypothetical protein
VSRPTSVPARKGKDKYPGHWGMEYLGSWVVRQLRCCYPEVVLAGFDSGFFAHCPTNATMFPEYLVDLPYFADMREFPAQGHAGTNAVSHLARITL